MTAATNEDMLEQVPKKLLRHAELVAVVGSTAHGISVSQEGEGGDDLDVSGLFVPRWELLLGLEEAKPIVWRSKPDGVKSEAGDVDLSLQPLRKFVSLAFKGNPTILSVLFSPVVMRATDCGVILRKQRGLFASKAAGFAFKGYAESQYQRLRGERGRMSVNRPELVEAHGYDVKYASHVMRLCHQGVMLMTEGYMPMPVLPEAREPILAIRRGEVSLDDCLEQIAAAREALAVAVATTALPDYPPRETVIDLMVTLHQMALTRGLPSE